MEEIEKTQEEIDNIDDSLKKFKRIGIEKKCNEAEEEYKDVLKKQLDFELKVLDEEQDLISTSSTLDKSKTNYQSQRDNLRKSSSKKFDLEKKKIREDIMIEKDNFLKEKKQKEKLVKTKLKEKLNFEKSFKSKISEEIKQKMSEVQMLEREEETAEEDIDTMQKVILNIQLLVNIYKKVSYNVYYDDKLKPLEGIMTSCKQLIDNYHKHQDEGYDNKMPCLGV